ncbi:MAG: phytanoyl-CoA dioxygenase family protein, partial [Solirubrobacteraceae bacterium]
APGPAPRGWPSEELIWAFAADAAPATPTRVVTSAGGATSRPMGDDAGSATSTAAPQVLTDDRWQDFDRDGFLHLGRVLDGDELDALRRRADDLALGRVHNDEILMQLDTGGDYDELPGAVPQLGTHLYRKIQGLECDDRFRPLVVHPLFMEICGRMYGPHAPVSLFRAMVMNKPAGQGTVLPWHQDGGDVWKLDRDPLVTIWVALDDATVENGCMEAVRGSHRKGLLTAEGSTVSDENAALHCPAELVVPLEVAAGHGLLLHNWLIHRSGVNPSSAPRRAFTGCYMDGRTISVLTGATFPLVAGAVDERAHPYVAQLETDRAALSESFRAAEEYAHSLRERCSAAEEYAHSLRERGTAAEQYAHSLEERCRVAEEYAQSLEAERARSGEGRGRQQRAADRVRSRFRSDR